VVSEPKPVAKPVRGVKLSTVSLATFLFSLLCLGAFWAGRPPLIAAHLDSTHAASHARTIAKPKRILGGSDKRLANATAAYGTMMREGS
jgi:hypothetical protein